MKIINTISVITLAAVASYGCSSSGGGSAPTPNGIYSGNITGGATGGAPINGGEKGIVYNNRLMVFSTALDIQQLFDTSITVDGTAFSGTLYYYNNGSPVRDQLDLNATFVAATSITASFSNSTTTILNDGTLNLTADASLYNKGSSATTVTGSWQGTHGNLGNATSLAIDASGDITGNDVQGCNFTGTITPADSSVNVYSVTLTSTGGAGCTSLPTATYTGFAWTEGTNDATLNFTVADGTNSRSVVLTKN